VRQPVTLGTGVARRAARRVRGTVVPRAGEELGQEDRQHDLPSRLRVRAAPGLDPRHPGEHRAGIVAHLHQDSHMRRLPPGCLVRSSA
jgi:hypothetical protein